MNIDAKLLELVKGKVKKVEIKQESKLSDLGLDSIDKADLLISIEDEFNIQFSDEELATISTVQELKDCLTKKL